MVTILPLLNPNGREMPFEHDMAPNKDAKTTAEEPSSSPLSSPPEGAVSSPVKSDRKLGKKRDEALASPTPATKKGAVPRRPKKAKVTKPVKKRKWTAANLITDHKSPLATADLRVSHILILIQQRSSLILTH